MQLESQFRVAKRQVADCDLIGHKDTHLNVATQEALADAEGNSIPLPSKLLLLESCYHQDLHLVGGERSIIDQELPDQTDECSLFRPVAKLVVRAEHYRRAARGQLALGLSHGLTVEVVNELIAIVADAVVMPIRVHADARIKSSAPIVKPPPTASFNN